MGSKNKDSSPKGAYRKHLTIADFETLRGICGPENVLLQPIENCLKVTLKNSGGGLDIIGDKGAVLKAHDVLEEALQSLVPGEALKPDILQALAGKHSSEDDLIRTKTTVKAKNQNQASYIKAIKTYPVTLGIGSAGTGKTYLATMMACEAFTKGLVKKIILCRPVVEAGEKIGYLPGDLKEKLDPYMQPFYGALNEAYGAEIAKKFIKNGEVEILPLAFMRGRSLKDSFIILDEAQNTSPEQVHMFLTRMDAGSIMVITGDPSQCDLPIDRASGKRINGLTYLLDVIEHAKKNNIPGFDRYGIINFNSSDVVRHEMVATWITLRDKFEQAAAASIAPNNAPKTAKPNGSGHYTQTNGNGVTHEEQFVPG